MFVYINYRTEGFINKKIFSSEEKLKAIPRLLSNSVDDTIYKSKCPYPEELVKRINSTKPTLIDINESIRLYEEWIAPISGKAVFHKVESREPVALE